MQTLKICSGPTIRIGQEILCFPYAGFFLYVEPILFQIIEQNLSYKKKSRIRETSNLSTDADRRTDTILESLRDLSRKKKKKKKKMGRLTCPRVHASTRTRVHA